MTAANKHFERVNIRKQDRLLRERNMPVEEKIHI